MIELFTHKVDHYDNMYSVRYYVPDERMSRGVVRLSIMDKEGIIPQRVLMIVNVDINGMIDYVGDKGDVGEQEMKDFIIRVKEHAKEVVSQVGGM